jgi:transposase InsO family protein
MYKYIKSFILKAELETGERLKCLRTDNGKEFSNTQISKLLDDHGIRHEMTIPYCPEQNGRIERENRTIIETARSRIGQEILGRSSEYSYLCTQQMPF